MLDDAALCVEYWTKCTRRGVSIVDAVFRGEETFDAGGDSSVDEVVLERDSAKADGGDEGVLAAEGVHKFVVRKGVGDVVHLDARREGGFRGFACDDGDREKGGLRSEGFDEVVTDVGAAGAEDGDVSKRICCHG